MAAVDAKMAGFARRQAEVVVANIVALSAGRSDLDVYEPMGPTAIAVPIGPEGGSGQFPGQDELVPSETIAELKGRDMMVGAFAELFGLAAEAAS